jgi:hypothetical protein
MKGSGKRALRRQVADVLRKSCGAGVAAAALSLVSGCMVPSYHLPAGFSSSYQRQIYGMEPVPPDPNNLNLGMAAVETHAGIFYPTSAFHDSQSPSQQLADRKTTEPMLLETEKPKVAALPPISVAL